MTAIYILMFCIFILCILLMRRVLNHEITIFDLNDKLNLSDKEYVDLFNENIKLSEEIDDLKVKKIMRKLKV